MKGLLLNWCCGVAEFELPVFISLVKKGKADLHTIPKFIRALLQRERVAAIIVTGALSESDEIDNYRDLEFMQSLGLIPVECGRNPKTGNTIYLWVIK